MTNKLYSFLRRELTSEWDDDGSTLLTKPSFDASRSLYSGAAYRNDGSLILRSLRPSLLGHWRPIDPVAIHDTEFLGDIPHIEIAVFGGHYFDMWGHFLIETLSTAYLSQYFPSCPVVFFPFNGSGQELRMQKTLDRVRPILRASGWGDREFKLIYEKTKFSRLIVPERSVVYGVPIDLDSIMPEFSKVSRNIISILGSNKSPKEKLFVKRPYGHAREHPIELVIEPHLVNLGFSVIDVANMTPEEQVMAFSEAKTIIGFAGSSLHNSIFCHVGTKVIEMLDPRAYGGWSSDRRNPIQKQLCDVLQQDLIPIETYFGSGQEFLPLSNESILSEISKSVLS